MTDPSIATSTPVTPVSSEAVAAMPTDPPTVAPPAGDVTDTVGHVTSTGGVVVTTSCGRCVDVPSRETYVAPSALEVVMRTEYVPSVLTKDDRSNCTHVLSTAEPPVVIGVASAVGAVFHVTPSVHVCEATRKTLPDAGEGFVVYSRSATPLTVSDPTPVTVNRSSVWITGELSTVSDVAVPYDFVGLSARTVASACGVNVTVRGAPATGAAESNPATTTVVRAMAAERTYQPTRCPLRADGISIHHIGASTPRNDPSA